VQSARETQKTRVDRYSAAPLAELPPEPLDEAARFKGCEGGVPPASRWRLAAMFGGSLSKLGTARGAGLATGLGAAFGPGGDGRVGGTAPSGIGGGIPGCGAVAIGKTGGAGSAAVCSCEVSGRPGTAGAEAKASMGCS